MTAASMVEPFSDLLKWPPFGPIGPPRAVEASKMPSLMPRGNAWSNPQCPYIHSVPLSNGVSTPVLPGTFASLARSWNAMNLSHVQQSVNAWHLQQARHHLNQSASSSSCEAKLASSPKQANQRRVTGKTEGIVNGAYSNLQLEHRMPSPVSFNNLRKMQRERNSASPPTGQLKALSPDLSQMAGVDAIAMPSPVQVRRDMQARIEKSERAISPLTTMLKETSLSPRGTSSPNSSTAKKGQPNGLRISSFQGNSFKCSSTTSDIGYQTIDSPSQPVEKAAIMHRHAASSHEANCTWSGVLPIRKYDNPTYSNKVFLGGVPWDIEPGGVQEAFTEFGHVKVEFPGNVPFQKKFGGRPRSEEDSVHCYGYLYVIFESDKHVKEMLKHCTRGGPHGKKEGSCSSNGDGEYYYKISSRKMRSKEVQVIPWVLCDSNYVAGPHPYHKLNNETTIFVGALHGMLNAEGLAHVMNDLFGNVVYAGVDTDKYKYPIGSGRVTFSSHRSYMRAVNAAFVEIKTTKFVKKVQIDPYLEEVPCSVCNSEVGPYFCRNQCCFKYYCSRCWSKVHGDIDPSLGVHSPVMRNSKNGGSANVSIKTNLSDLYKKLSSEP